jgi:hypothetical protein
MTAATERPGALAVRERQALSQDFGATMSGAQLKFIANTEFIPAGLRGNLPAIGACVATGRALGLADMTSLRSIHIIDGKASFSAELMTSLARKAGHSIIGEVSPQAAKVTGKRGDNGDTMDVEWTFEQASKIKRKGKALTDGDAWKNYPEAMLWARAVSQLCRMLFADCFAGASYTPEELGAGDVTADELMDEPAQDPVSAGASPPEPPPTPDTPTDEAEEAEFEPVVEPGPITQEQKDRLLELVAMEKIPNVGPQLTARIKEQYGAGSYNALNEGQMGELLGWLEEQTA